MIQELEMVLGRFGALVLVATKIVDNMFCDGPAHVTVLESCISTMQ